MDDPRRLIETKSNPEIPTQGTDELPRLHPSTLVLILGILLALFVPILGPLTALVMGIVMRKSPGAFILIILGVFFISFHIVFNFLFPIFPAA